MARMMWDALKAVRARDSAVEAARAAATPAFELAERVWGMREQRGWSQRDLAKRAGVGGAVDRGFEVRADRWRLLRDAHDLHPGGRLDARLEQQHALPDLEQLTHTV